MRIRKKLIVLHTFFSLVLAAILLLALRPAIETVVDRAERHACRVALDSLASNDSSPSAVELSGVRVVAGSASDVDLSPRQAKRLRSRAGYELVATTQGGRPRVVRWDADRGVFRSASITASAARADVRRLYVLVVAALFAVYGLIALALEVFVLPRHVWRPIERLRRADAAVQEGRRDEELIPEREIPADELGEIMRSRNESIVKLRRHEAALADALERLERVAGDLKRKNHLLETVRRNMADQDRLASLGMMSAGIAHELNTPLSVLKGSVERVGEGGGVDESQARLMQRMVARLERISESLLDFARARPPSRERVDMRSVIDEAWELVRLDREAREVTLQNDVSGETVVQGDADRLSQVFVNILRNAADALGSEGRIVVTAEESLREGRRWLSVICKDNGPGIDPEILPRLFEPFTSTRLDARGAGLGLAVAEGIVRGHGGVMIGRNAPEGGAIFEVMLPIEGAPAESGEQERAESASQRSASPVDESAS